MKLEELSDNIISPTDVLFFLLPLAASKIFFNASLGLRYTASSNLFWKISSNRLPELLNKSIRNNWLTREHIIIRILFLRRIFMFSYTYIYIIIFSLFLCWLPSQIISGPNIYVEFGPTLTLSRRREFLRRKWNFSFLIFSILTSRIILSLLDYLFNR